jgi:hypothetical protein
LAQVPTWGYVDGRRWQRGFGKRRCNLAELHMTADIRQKRRVHAQKRSLDRFDPFCEDERFDTQDVLRGL